MLTADDLSRIVDRVVPVAQACGLNPGPVHFELVSAETLQALAARAGIPVRHAHWTYGKNFQRIRAAHDFRWGHTYELVINNRPVYAFIDAATTTPQALVIVAHVMAHADFFGHNRLFDQAAPDMVNRMALHRRRVEDAIRRVGSDAVETLIDAALVLTDFIGSGGGRGEGPGESPDDVLGYIIRYGERLLEWEREILSVVYDEARYFRPQQLTKVTNEGYATFWHTRIGRSLELTAAEAWEISRWQSAIVAPTGGINPYRLGWRLFETAFAHGGMEAVWGARRLFDDVGLVRAWLDPLSAGAGAGTDASRQQLLRELDNAGAPRIRVSPDSQSGCLELVHRHDGRDLCFEELPAALKLVAGRLWRGPVRLETRRRQAVHHVIHDGIRWVDQVG